MYRFLTELLNKEPGKIDHGACKRAHSVTAAAARPEDVNSNLHGRRRGPNPVTGPLTTTAISNSCSSESNVLYWPLRALYAHGAEVHI